MDLTTISPEGGELFNLIETYLPFQERVKVREAFEFARQAHEGQKRKSGEPYLIHPVTIAYFLAQYQLDAPSLIAALLHDVAEDTSFTLQQINERFGEEVGKLVDSLTKFEETAPQLGSGKIRDVSLWKLFSFMADDVRVGLIKLFDRLHNMLTIKYASPDSRRKNAEETLDIYAPLANRLGIWFLKNDLERLSLQAIDLNAYEQIRQQLEQIYHQQQPLFDRMSQQIATLLTKAGLTVQEIKNAPQNIYPIYHQAQEYSKDNGLHFKIDTTLRLNILLNDKEACYQALGQLHGVWRPVPKSFDDYIAAPRNNLYQALHTTVQLEHGPRVKVRIRTVVMNILSEVGVLARWNRRNLWSPEIADQVDKLLGSIEDNINLEPQNPSVGIETLVQDVLGEQIMVYTPKGDVQNMLRGATPLDFAYAIHSDLGHYCRAAMVNNRPFPLNQPLADGDWVQIIKREHHPQRIWLDENLGYLTTQRAKSSLGRWFKHLAFEVAIAEGKQLMADELATLGVTETHSQIAKWLHYGTVDDLYLALGQAELLPTDFAMRVLAYMWPAVPSRLIGSEAEGSKGERFIVLNAGDGRRTQLCRICLPRPDDEIIGFFRADESVTVHKVGCHALPNDPLFERILKLNWGSEEERRVRPVTIRIKVHDRPGLLFEIADLVGHEKVNITSVSSQSQRNQAEVVLAIEVAQPRQLVRLLHRLHALLNVFSVCCQNKWK